MIRKLQCRDYKRHYCAFETETENSRCVQKPFSILKRAAHSAFAALTLPALPFPFCVIEGGSDGGKSSL